MNENSEKSKRKTQEKLHRCFMQMNEMENILQMEKEIFEENSKKANEELDRKRMDVNSEAEALAEIIKG